MHRQTPSTIGISSSRGAITHGWRILGLALLVLLLSSQLVGCNKLTDTFEDSSSTTSTEASFTQDEGEILLEPAGVAGPDSFTGETFVPVGPTSTLHIPSTVTSLTTVSTAASSTTAGSAATQTTQVVATTTTVAGVQVATVSGGTPALYGGSKSTTLVDKEGQLRFFEQNPEKAAAFCAALNADPTLRWSGGTQVQPFQLRDYFAELTPVMLTRDTRVTNHGYRDGKPTPRQSVLQAGQMVLVDRYGVPRVRCECGNPLTPPTPVTKTPVYTGPRWPDFNPVTVVVIQQTTVVIQNFILIDIFTGEVFGQPFGTAGSGTVAEDFGMWSIGVDLTWDDDYNIRVTTVSWSGFVAVDPYPALDGIGDGSMHIDGTTFEEGSGNVTGTWVADVSFVVDVGGALVFDGESLVLDVQPVLADYSVDNISMDTTNPEGIREKIEALLPTILADALVAMPIAPDFAQPVWADVALGEFLGAVTLTPYEP